MIQDTLKANPGMRETYRAYGGKMAVEYRIEELRKRRENLLQTTYSEKRISSNVTKNWCNCEVACRK